MDSFNAFAMNHAGLFAVLTLIMAAAAIAMSALAIVRLRVVTRPFTWLTGQIGGGTDTLPALLQTVEKNATDVADLRTTIEGIAQENLSHLKRIGLVRYDAFDGIAGQQSYSLCLLDDKKNGFVLSNLVGRDFSRSYAVEIAAGVAPRKLGREEGQALELAMKNRR